jgi:hypothetical protein
MTRLRGLSVNESVVVRCLLAILLCVAAVSVVRTYDCDWNMLTVAVWDPDCSCYRNFDYDNFHCYSGVNCSTCTSSRTECNALCDTNFPPEDEVRTEVNRICRRDCRDSYEECMLYCSIRSPFE